MNTTETERSLERTLADLQRRYGPGAIMRLDGKVAERVDAVIPTGSMGLDRALGIGGLPRGRLIEIYGPAASGKTTLALHVIANAQAEGGTAAFIDAEHALDPVYARQIGVDLPQLLFSQPNCGEQALEIVEGLARSGAVDLIVIDSVAALTPEAEISGDMGETQLGLHARMMSKAMRKLTGIMSRTRCCVIFINQLRHKIGVTFGSSETTTGGNALKYYTSVRLDIRRIGAIKQGDRIVGSRTRVKIVKNKLAPPFARVEFDIRFGLGICPVTELLEQGEIVGVVRRNGAWYRWGEMHLGQGREAARTKLLEEPARLDQLREQVLAAQRALMER